MAGRRQGSEGRLDNFVDAAFAFAVTLLVVGGEGAPDSFDALEAALLRAPVFAIGFAFLAMFWHAHVRWRHYGGPAGPAATLASVLLVFLVLLYVYPLRLMATSLVDYLGGGSALQLSVAERARLFLLYGLGFAAMSGTVAALFLLLRRASEEPGQRAVVSGELVIWSMLAGAGLLSAMLTLTPVRFIAPWVYALLPVAIGVFAARKDWSGRGAEEEAEAT